MQWTSGNRPILLSSLLSNQFSDKETVNGLKKSFSPVHGRWSWKNSESLGTTRFPRIPFRQEFTCHPAIRVDISADLLHGDQDFTTGCLTQGACFLSPYLISYNDQDTHGIFKRSTSSQPTQSFQKSLSYTKDWPQSKYHNGATPLWRVPKAALSLSQFDATQLRMRSLAN